jgi:uncharacterized membrane protein
MNKTRLEAFSDGVIAIIITIMVLELKVPHSTEWHALRGHVPIFLSYLMSFIYIGIYWGNHHHLLHTTTHINGAVMWANLHQLFWLSLVPFGTAWMGENNFARNTVVMYAILLLGCAIAFYILQQVIMKMHLYKAETQDGLKKAEWKGYISLAAYIAAIPIAFIDPRISCGLFVLVALVWFVPEKNIEKALNE